MDFDKLKQELASFTPTENQTYYRSLTLTPSQQHTEQDLPAAEGKNKQLELPAQTSATRKKEKPDDLTRPEQECTIALRSHVKTYNRKGRVSDNTYACPL